ncbi:hypothetical protein BGS_1384 [Beggiatoa sp. SS]|nr:hypothetical protein BGS_1384 [Beggiatoa sp. SS]
MANPPLKIVLPLVYPGFSLKNDSVQTCEALFDDLSFTFFDKKSPKTYVKKGVEMGRPSKAGNKKQGFFST